MSGFFAVRRERLLAIDPEAAGFKIGLEVIAQGGGALTVSEIPIIFPDRIHGESKIGKAQLIAYLRRLFVLAGGAVSTGGAARFAAVGLIGMFVDLLVFAALHALGAELITAHVASFCVATVSNYGLNARWTFADGSGSRELTGSLYLRFFTVCLLALAIRGGVLAGGLAIFGLPPQAAIVCAIGVAAIVSYLGSAFFVFPSTNPRVPGDIRWRVATIGVASYVIVLRLLFLGLVDLLPQEAYYWNYSQHLDIGYLDHPPMVAWLIALGTSIFGNNEFGVRFAAWLGWFATALFTCRLTHRLFGKSAALVSLLLVAALPFYFATGFVMTPDAPLVAAWAGALYFLERALVGGRRMAWWGVGVCIGLGMLSKYTIALLAPATLAFMIVDARARMWLRRPDPYFASALALLLFSPVIYWNLENGLASFAFQGARRMEGTFHFSLLDLIGNAAILITPTGLVAAVAALWALHVAKNADPADETAQRVSRFILIFTMVPLAVFIGFSLSRGVKLNWTGPLWLAALPAISTAIVAVAERSSAFELAMRQVWVSTVAVSLVLYGLVLNYLVLGIPGVGYAVGLPNAPVAWSEFGREAADLELEVMQATGDEPLMIGLDTYDIASQLAFYGGGNGMANSVGRGVLGKKSLMYEYWYPAEPLRGRPAVIFAFKRSRIASPEFAKHFAALGETMERVVTKDGKPAGRFYYRIGHDYQGTVSGSRPSMLGAVLLAGAALSKCKTSRAGWIGCNKGCCRSRSVRRLEGRSKARKAARRLPTRHGTRSIQLSRSRSQARRRLQSAKSAMLVRTGCGADRLRSRSGATGTLGEMDHVDIHHLRIGVPTAAMVSLVLLLVPGCATQQLDPARGGRGSEIDQSYRNIDSPDEERGTCASIGSAMTKHFQEMEELRRQEEAERREPPSTVALAYGRLFGPEGAGYAAAEKLRQERIKVDQLEAVLAAKECSSIKTDMPNLR